MLRNNCRSRAVGLIRMRATLAALALYAGVVPALLAQNAQASAAPPVFPDLEFVGSEGGSVRLSELKGNVILLNVWATWCGPCKKELPVVQRMYDTYSDRNFVVLAVNVDADRKRVEPFVKQFNISLPVYYASPEDAGPLTAMGIPSTFICLIAFHLDGLVAGLAERQDPQRDPRVVGRDRDVDGRPVTDLLAAGRGRVGVEGGGEEDRAARRVEVEDLGRVGREAEAVVRGPLADRRRATAQDGDVEGVDLDLHQLLGRAGGAAARGPAANGAAPGFVSRRRRWSVQSPPFTTLAGARERRHLPNAPPPPANWNAVT